MLRSIPEIGKYINSRLSWSDCLSALSLALVLAALAVFLSEKRGSVKLPVLYRESGQVLGATSDARAFGSIHGTTYTYSWCSGSGQIKEANKVYFASAEFAESSGRTLSKLCQK
jgi:hypothetical protein